VPLRSCPGSGHLRLRWLPGLRRLLRGCPLDLRLLHRPPRSSRFYRRLRPWSWLRLRSRLRSQPWLRIWSVRLWSRLRLWTGRSWLRWFLQEIN
ncbi:unnamed protein product, partial [Ixodes persulcatus]